jgi:hypothetical protein
MVAVVVIVRYTAAAARGSFDVCERCGYCF